jgi:stalled ribosome rescue protein Dom34
MIAKKRIGIWMDHSEANLIDPESSKENETIVSKFTFGVKNEAAHKGEKLMHNKEQQMHEAFCKEIATKILKYDHVLLFGPTNAKNELHNYLKKDLHFKDIKIEIESSDNMTNNEKNAFVLHHFEKIPN